MDHINQDKLVQVNPDLLVRQDKRDKTENKRGNKIYLYARTMLPQCDGRQRSVKEMLFIYKKKQTVVKGNADIYLLIF